MTTPANTASPAPRPGFTLVEVVVSLAIMSILLVAIGSAIVLAGGAIPRSNDPAHPTDAAYQMGHEMATELQFALSFVERSVTAVEFYVPSRDADNVPELIRYAWSGAAGDPLTRRYNGGPIVNVVDSVEDFELDYDTIDVTVQEPTEVQSAEVELISYNGTTNLQTAVVQFDRWWGQYFKPTLPPDTIRWSVTRVKFMARRFNTKVLSTVDLRWPAPDLTPSSAILDTEIINANGLNGVQFMWVEKPLDAKYLPPGEGLCLVFWSSAGKAARLRYQSSGVTAPDVALAQGTPAWGPVATDQSLLFYVYGKHTTPGPPLNVTHTYLTGVQIEIQTSAEESSEFEIGTTLLHAPEIIP